MITRVNNQPRALLGENSFGTKFHLLVGRGDRGMVYFVCEQAPLLTLKSHGLPVHCPICRVPNPLKVAVG
jgi:hypothetical protein